MVDGDIFREVEEDLRRERAKQLWDRYGAIVLGGALAIIATVAGIKGYEYWQREQARAAGFEYAEALGQLSGDQKDQGAAELAKIANSGSGGFAVLAKLRLAGARATEGQPDQALALLDEIATSRGVDPVLRNLARLRAAMISLDKGDFTAVENRINDLATADSPWRHSARELLGLAAYKSGQRDKAETQFQEILGDLESPAGIRERSQAMLELIVRADAKSPESGATGAATGESAETGGGGTN